MKSKNKKIRRVLIVNRGEIAVRIIKALRKLQITSICVYSDADANSMARKLADISYNLPGSDSAATYLNIPKIIAIIKLAKADAVHPGYGFLAESSEFAHALEKEKIIFIGPSFAAMQTLGDKIAARTLMQKNNISILPGCNEAIKDYVMLESVAKEIGFPLILKAAAGGGGRGMQVVYESKDLRAAFDSCKHSALAFFGNDEVFCERFLENPRHIEIQVLFDNYGNGVHLFERDCTIQRRHQKLLEEAPSTYLSDEIRKEIGETAVNVARSANYSGAGTVEFICESPDKCYFMEMNTRIQVEHPVTELVSGVDLIEWQIRVARDEELTLCQSELKPLCYAIEVRINAEDPLNDFRPASGLITDVSFPSGANVRVDTHIYPNYQMPADYDSLLAKIIVTGKDRNDALLALKKALLEVKIAGVPTTTAFHEVLVEMPEFIESQYSTNFIEKNLETIKNNLSENSNGVDTQDFELDVDEQTALLSALVFAEKSRSDMVIVAENSSWKHISYQEGIQ